MASTGEAVYVAAPESNAQTRSSRTEWWKPATIALVPVAFILVATLNGIGTSPDSGAYTAPLEAGKLVLNPAYDFGQPLLTWVTGAGVGAVALNCVAVWCNLLVSHRLALAVSGSRGVALAVTAWLAVSVATTQVYSMLWSEPVFVLAVNSALLALSGLVNTRRLDPRLVVALIVAANVAGAMRYAAMFLVPVIGVALLLAVRGSVVRRLIVAAACSTTLLVAWAHNLLAGEAIMGPRPPRADTVTQVLDGIPFAVAGYVQNGMGLTTTRNLGLAALVAIVLLVAMWLRAGTNRTAILLAGWVACYTGALVASSLTTDLDGIGFRLSSPVLTSLAVLTFASAATVFPARACRWCLVVSLAWMVPSTLGWALQASAGAPMWNF